ncbi:MAG: Uma2 family endonuclease [Cytophagales bacterium]|jgi:Uma2 family endonuclease|nr:Uma2 family endonuclease [Cytophagales bacterium]
MIAIEKKPVRKPSTARKVPESLVYEIMDGEPLYYRGYKEVLSGKKTLEEIMGSSTLQSVLIQYLNRILFKQLDEKLYWIFSSESGVHINHRNNLSHDVAVYEKKVLSPDKISANYADVPCKIGFEIDIKADLSNPKHYDYVNGKTQKLLDFGVEKVIWIFTETQKVMIAPKEQDWLVVDWNKDVEVTDGIVFNIEKYLKKEGITVNRNQI